MKKSARTSSVKALKGMIKKPEVSVSIYDMNAAIADVIDLGVDRLADDKEAAADDAPPPVDRSPQS
ncbi:hypothetical protein [Pseudomonas aeruginosa]|uniref:hypothetical protein n=1 Tax=Pseudomonas aeruginosa TaxID=287 RepID=UPI0003D1F277|nr:hypothetical protein [Pseudomonas aeruginosa]AHB55514.1 hypothetical protein U769_11415 [Pseudomonas aeruginosa MTB-1]EIU3791702.1 hypothetical protein [Pseudomonas aeruginosa]EKV0492691.1 hypothetical protein [Pseudomonas aeruginosa]MCQ9873046.1 hypothetical protein [Pseudomonas aeruginosa]MCT5025581.1 hypothetical protein [Pseudomonas aeruginosa]